jgi:hypothetical protein
MSEYLYLLTICLPLGTILLVFGMRYFSAVQQAKARITSDATYRQIAEKGVAAASATRDRAAGFAAHFRGRCKRSLWPDKP